MPGLRDPRRTLPAAIVLIVLFTTAAWVYARRAVDAASGLILVNRATGGSPLSAPRRVAGLDPWRATPTGLTRWTGFLDVPSSGDYRFRAQVSGRFSLFVDGVPRLVAEETGAMHRVDEDLFLDTGFHAIEAEYETRGASDGRLSWGKSGANLTRLGGDDVYVDGSAGVQSAVRWEPRLRILAMAAWCALAFLVWLRGRHAVKTLWPAVAGILAVLIVIVGGLLRTEAVVGRYWPNPPPWADALRDFSQAHLHDPAYEWTLDEHPYDGDPTTYLRFAREMTGFYQAHVREPLFLAATRLGLWFADGSDLGVNWASAAFSTFTILAIYLTGSAAFNRGVGILATGLFAVERTVISWSVEGWRDDAFACMVMFSTWGLLRLRARPSRTTSIVAGVFCAAACLTRVTALSFVVPCLLWLLVEGGDNAAARRWAVVLASAVAMALLGPYLFACWAAFGDPLYAINYNTGFYRARASLDASTPMHVGRFLGLLGGPVQLVDTGIHGLTEYPFANKWTGFDALAPLLRVWLPRLAVPGLALFLVTGAGRLLLVALFASLLPYAFTYDILGGGEWRFTLPAYPFYLIAATLPVAGLPTLFRTDRRTVARGILIGVGVPAAAWIVASGVHYARVKADIRAGDGRIQAGLRDGFLFGGGWQPPVTLGNQEVRFTRGTNAVLHLPLADASPLALTFRMDPILFDGAPAQTVDVRINDRSVGVLALAWDPERIGSYELTVPADATRPGRNRVELRAAYAIDPRRVSGGTHSELARGETSFLLWQATVSRPTGREEQEP